MLQPYYLLGTNDCPLWWAYRMYEPMVTCLPHSNVTLCVVFDIRVDVFLTFKFLINQNQHYFVHALLVFMFMWFTQLSWMDLLINKYFVLSCLVLCDVTNRFESIACFCIFEGVIRPLDTHLWFRTNSSSHWSN